MRERGTRQAWEVTGRWNAKGGVTKCNASGRKLCTEGGVGLDYEGGDGALADKGLGRNPRTGGCAGSWELTALPGTAALARASCVTGVLPAVLTVQLSCDQARACPTERSDRWARARGSPCQTLAQVHIPLLPASPCPTDSLFQPPLQTRGTCGRVLVNRTVCTRPRCANLLKMPHRNARGTLPHLPLLSFPRFQVGVLFWGSRDILGP